MPEHISKDLILALSKLVEERLGLCFPAERLGEFERKIHTIASQNGASCPQDYVMKLLSSTWRQTEIELLVKQLTVGETYFFRDKTAFEALRTTVLPELIAARRVQDRRLRIWSAGCCTGEEAYSIAILLTQLIPDWKEWNLTVLGTDINPQFLQRATAGIYSQWSFREWPDGRSRYLVPLGGGKHELRAEFRQIVSFAPLNLAEDSYPSPSNNTNAMDLILCRNVLMYFSSAQIMKVATKLERSLVTGGWLLVSGSELSHESFAEFVPVNFPGAMFYRKEDRSEHTFAIPATPALNLSEIPAFTASEFRPPWPFTAASPDAVDRSIKDVAEPPDSAVEERGEQNLLDEAVRTYDGGRYPESAQKCELWLAQQPNDVHAHRLLVRAYANQGAFEEALRSCERALSRFPLDQALHYLLALVLQEQGALDKAAASLRRALYIDPKFALAQFALSMIRHRQGRPRDASRHRRNALHLLHSHSDNEVIPESEGMTAARLAEVICRTEEIEA